MIIIICLLKKERKKNKCNGYEVFSLLAYYRRFFIYIFLNYASEKQRFRIEKFSVERNGAAPGRHGYGEGHAQCAHTHNHQCFYCLVHPAKRARERGKETLIKCTSGLSCAKCKRFA